MSFSNPLQERTKIILDSVVKCLQGSVVIRKIEVEIWIVSFPDDVRVEQQYPSEKIKEKRGWGRRGRICLPRVTGTYGL